MLLTLLSLSRAASNMISLAKGLLSFRSMPCSYGRNRSSAFTDRSRDYCSMMQNKPASSARWRGMTITFCGKLEHALNVLKKCPTYMSGPKANLSELKNGRVVAETSATYCLAINIRGVWEWLRERETEVLVVLLQITIRGQTTVSSISTRLLVSR